MLIVSREAGYCSTMAEVLSSCCKLLPLAHLRSCHVALNPEHWPHLQARELADQDWLLFVILTPELVDLCQPVGQVLPAALPVCRHAAWLAAGLTAGTTAGEDTTQYDQHHRRTHRTTRGSPMPGRARQPQNTLRNPVSLPTLTHYYCTLDKRT